MTPSSCRKVRFMPTRTPISSRIPHAIAFFAISSAPAQVEPSATGGSATEDDSQMMTPPPVSGMPYANSSSSEERSNYLSASVTGSAAYIDNVLPGAGATPLRRPQLFCLSGRCIRSVNSAPEGTVQLQPQFYLLPIDRQRICERTGFNRSQRGRGLPIPTQPRGCLQRRRHFYQNLERIRFIRSVLQPCNRLRPDSSGLSDRSI